jgi:hypothetical protein
MATEERSTKRSTANGGASDEARGALVGVMSTAQDAAERVKTVAETAAERLPDAMASAQVAMTDTQRALDELPNQALVIGTSFSLGLGVGMFLTGTNRLLVLVALVPAAAMAATLVGRGSATESTPPQRSARATGGGTA